MIDNITETKLAEQDWAYADHACQRIIATMALIPIADPLYAKLHRELDAATATRREAGNRIATLAMAELDRRRATA